VKGQMTMVVLVSAALALPAAATGNHTPHKPPVVVQDSGDSHDGLKLVTAGLIGWWVTRRYHKRHAPPPAVQLVCPKPEPVVCGDCEERIQRAELACGKGEGGR
jgi:hypothetical protein